MIRSFLALVVLNGWNLVFWSCMGLCRLTQDCARRVGHQAAAMALAATVILFAGAIMLGLFSAPVLWLAGVMSDALLPAPSTAAGVFRALLLTWIGLCGAISSYLGARLFNLRHLLAAIALFGVLYWLTVIGLAQGALETGLAPHWQGMPPSMLLGLATSSCGLGVLLARRRDRPASAVEIPAAPRSAPGRLTPDDVAVVIAAHNEEKTIHFCLDAISKCVSAGNVFVGSDGSTDDTVAIASAWGCNVLDIQPNGGKARALKTVIEHFELCERYAAVLILDADAEIDEHYIERALPLLERPGVAAVAGHAIPKWWPHRRPRASMFYVAYRVRLYRLTQALFRYGQTWKHSNVSFIVPGFASMYRCSVLPRIAIDAPGLIIEDFNMTFELHHKRLGRIAYSPKVRCLSHEVHSFRDYFKQVRRWHLGFWQTVRRHGFWPSWFSVSLAVFAVEMLLQSLIFLAVPFLLTWFLFQPGEAIPVWLPQLGTHELTLADLATGVFLADYAMTLLISAVERKPILMLYGLGFLLLRWIDALLFLYTLPLSFVEKSDGRWVSPQRV